MKFQKIRTSRGKFGHIIRFYFWKNATSDLQKFDFILCIYTILLYLFVKWNISNISTSFECLNRLQVLFLRILIFYDMIWISAGSRLWNGKPVWFANWSIEITCCTGEILMKQIKKPVKKSRILLKDKFYRKMGPDMKYTRRQKSSQSCNRSGRTGPVPDRTGWNIWTGRSLPVFYRFIKIFLLRNISVVPLRLLCKKILNFSHNQFWSE
jgi:hypothetical protein